MFLLIMNVNMTISPLRSYVQIATALLPRPESVAGSSGRDNTTSSYDGSG